MEQLVSISGLAMKEEIEQFKKTNGNASYSEKELLMYAISRIDKLDNKLSVHIQDCMNRFVEKALFWKIISVLGSLLMLVAGIVLGFK